VGQGLFHYRGFTIALRHTALSKLAPNRAGRKGLGSVLVGFRQHFDEASISSLVGEKLSAS
jgi:hypothetical protein